MLDKYLDEYVEKLYNRQNINVAQEQMNLYTKEQYYEILKPVIEIVTKYKDFSLEELRNILYNKSGIEEKVRDFIYRKEVTPGMVFSYGTQDYKETVVIGNKQEVSVDQKGNLIPAIEKMTEDTIFDLASVTKVFTSLSILKLVQNGIIKLDDEVKKYTPEFKNLDGVTIFDLISFGVPLKTEGRVDTASSKEEAEQILKTMYVDKGNNMIRPYTDMGAMVLKYVVENASGMNYYKFVDEAILKPLKMSDTYASVPKFKLYRVAPTDVETKYFNDGRIVDLKIKGKGSVNDEKAYILGQTEGVLSGHAGMFSTAQDMTSLARGIIGGQVIDEEYIAMMAKNRTGKKYIDDGKEKFVQYLGFLCYSKHPILADSELFHAMSGMSFASGGFTGNQFTVDPINQLYFYLGSNRTHNRVSVVDPKQRQNVIYDENGKGSILLGDKLKTTSYRYAWDRDEAVVHPALKLSIQYKMLEDIYKLMNEKIEKEEKVRQL